MLIREGIPTSGVGDVDGVRGEKHLHKRKRSGGSGGGSGVGGGMNR